MSNFIEYTKPMSSPPKVKESHDYENPFDVVNELSELKKRRIKGTRRRIFEHIAKYNLSKEYPISDEIGKELKISYQTLKKELTRSVQEGFLVHHPEKKGHNYRYVLYNMQDYNITTLESTKRNNNSNDDLDMEGLYQSASLLISILNAFIEDNHLTFHNISFITELNDKDDYFSLDWIIQSQKNKAKVYEFKVARHRSCVITIYPNGRVMIDIKCSMAPFDLFNIDGRNDLRKVCGQVFQEIINNLSHLSPLKTDISDWLLTQIDGAYDIQIRDIEEKMNEGKLPHQHNTISLRRMGVLKIKHLDQIFQFYEKMLPTGPSLRLESRLLFKESKPNIETFTKSMSLSDNTAN
jgi:phage pi2 protein 07